MIRLILFFLPDLLRTAGLALIGIILVLFVGSRLNVDRELLAAPGFVILTLGFAGGTVLQRNSSWIKSIPVNRAGFLLGTLWVSALQLALMSGVYAIFVIVSKAWVPDLEKQQWVLDSFVSGFLKDLGSGGPFGVLVLQFLFAFFFMSSFSPFVNRLKYSQFFESIPLKWKLGYFGGAILAGIAINEIGSFFFGCMAFLGLIWWSIQNSNQRELALYPASRIAMRVVVIAFMISQGALVYGLAHRDLRGSDARRAFNASYILGSLALPIPEERLIEFMNETKDAGLVTEMIQSNPRILSLVNLEVWLKSRSDPKMVLAIEKKLEAVDFEKGKIEELLQKYDELKFDPRPHLYVKLLRSKVKGEEAKDFLVSSSRHTLAFGILLCRKWVEQSCVPGLIDQIKVLSDKDPFQRYLLGEILKTLSVLKGEHLGLDFYADVRSEKFKALDWVEPDLNCREWVQNLSPGVIQSQDEVSRWNHCILIALKKGGPEPVRQSVVGFLEKDVLDRDRTYWISLLKKLL